MATERYVKLAGRRFDCPRFHDTWISGWHIRDDLVLGEGVYRTDEWNARRIEEFKVADARYRQARIRCWFLDRRWITDLSGRRLDRKIRRTGSGNSVGRVHRFLTRRLLAVKPDDQIVHVNANRVEISKVMTGFTLQDVVGCALVGCYFGVYQPDVSEARTLWAADSAEMNVP